MAEECALFLLHALSREAANCFSRLRELSLRGANDESARRNYRAGLATINDWPCDLAIEEASRLKVEYPGIEKMLLLSVLQLARSPSCAGVYGCESGSIDEDAKRARLSDCYQRFMTYIAGEPEARDIDFVCSSRLDRRCLFADALRSSLHGIAAHCLGLSRGDAPKPAEPRPTEPQPPQPPQPPPPQAPQPQPPQPQPSQPQAPQPQASSTPAEQAVPVAPVILIQPQTQPQPQLFKLVPVSDNPKVVDLPE